MFSAGITWCVPTVHMMHIRNLFPCFLDSVNFGRQEQHVIEQIRKVLLGESSIPAADIPLR